jgi:hypothetical protein
VDSKESGKGATADAAFSGGIEPSAGLGADMINLLKPQN